MSNGNPRACCDRSGRAAFTGRRWRPLRKAGFTGFFCRPFPLRTHESLSLLMHADRAPPFSKGRYAFRPDFFSQAPNNPASTLAFPRLYVRSIGAMKAFRFDPEDEKKATSEGAVGNN